MDLHLHLHQENGYTIAGIKHIIYVQFAYKKKYMICTYIMCLIPAIAHYIRIIFVPIFLMMKLDFLNIFDGKIDSLIIFLIVISIEHEIKKKKIKIFQMFLTC